MLGLTLYLSALFGIDQDVFAQALEAHFNYVCQNSIGCITFVSLQILEDWWVPGGRALTQTQTVKINAEFIITGNASAVVNTLSDSGNYPPDMNVTDSSAEITTQAGQWDFSIARQGDLEAVFDDASNGEEIMMNFQISDRPYEVFLYKRDCSSPMEAMSYTSSTTSREGGFKNVNFVRTGRIVRQTTAG